MKNIFSKLWYLSFLVFVLVLMTSCKKNTPELETVPKEEEITTTETDKYQEKIKVTLCLDTISGNSIGKALYDGITRVKEQLDDYYEVSILEMGSNPLKWQEYLYQAADDYTDIIIGIGSKNKDYFETIPTEYPDTKFILMDQVIDYTEADLSNVLSVIFEDHYSGFLAGSAAALYTPASEEEDIIEETSKPLKKIIGFIGEEKEDEDNNFLVGFIEGAKQIDPDIKILINFIDNAKEEQTAEALTESQIAKGAEVIFAASKSSDSKILEQCSLSGIKAINRIYSHSKEGIIPEEESVLLTSAMKLYDEGIFSLLKEYYQDEKSLGFGKTKYCSFNENAVGIDISEALLLSLGDKKMEQLENLQNKIKEKGIFVPKASDMTEDELKEYITH